MGISEARRLEELAAQLVEAGRFLALQGWMPATSGNCSARVDAERAMITVSGRDKGRLDPKELMLIDMDGASLSPGKKPSAEALLHASLYRRRPDIGAVLHTHSVHATVLSLLEPEALWLSDLEVLKALPGIATHAARVRVPVLPNEQDIARLASVLEACLELNPETSGFLIAGHGFYTWGATVGEAVRCIEAFEFLFECECLLRRIRRP